MTREVAAAGSPVEARLASFLSAFAGRELSPAERHQAAADFVDYFSADGVCGKPCRTRLGQLTDEERLLRAHPGSPEDLAYRHRLLEANLFHNSHAFGTLLVRLLMEPDPIRVIDYRCGLFMTERDLIAQVNLRRFAESASKSPDFAAEITSLAKGPAWEMADALDKQIGLRSRGCAMHTWQFFGAQLWAGLRREWRGMTSAERGATYAYVAQGRPMAAALFAKLVGVNEQYAGAVLAAEQRRLGSGNAFSQAGFLRFLELQGQAAAISAFQDRAAEATSLK